MSAIKSAVITLVDFIKADAGVAESQFDARVAALYSAYFHILKSGNKTQWNLVETQLALYSNAKACGALVGTPQRATPKAKRAFEVFGAYRMALEAVGIPSVMKDGTKEQMETKAAELSEQFATMVTVTLTPEAKIVPTAEEKASKAAEKAAEKERIKAESDAALAATIQQEASKLAADMAPAVSMADMVRMVAAAAKSGALDAEQLALLDASLDNVAVVSFELPEEVAA